MANAEGQGLSRTVGSILVVVITILIGLLAFFNVGGPVYIPPHLAFVLTLFFVLVIRIAFTVVSARANLRSGSLNIVLLRAAILITGLATMFAIWVLNPNVPSHLAPDQAITLNNISILIGAVLLLLSAIATSSGTVAVELPRRKIDPRCDLHAIVRHDRDHFGRGIFKPVPSLSHQFWFDRAGHHGPYRNGRSRSHRWTLVRSSVYKGPFVHPVLVHLVAVSYLDNFKPFEVLILWDRSVARPVKPFPWHEVGHS